MHLVVFLLCLLISTEGFTGPSHRMVAFVASKLILRKTRRFVKEHLDRNLQSSLPHAESAMVYHSTWADRILKSGQEDYDWSSSLHFSHTPNRACDRFDFDRDCQDGRCVVSAIANYTERASDISAPKEWRAEALKFIIHFVADAHQPLHVGFARDEGGNKINLASPAMSLHDVWDTELFEFNQRRAIQEGASDVSWYALAQPMIEQLTDPTDRTKEQFMLSLHSVKQGLDFASEIASDTSLTTTCNLAYMDENFEWIPREGYSLSEEYLETRSVVYMQQLKKAAVRLSQLLDVIASAYFEAKSMVAPQLHASNSFEVLALEFDPSDYVFDVEETLPHVKEGPVILGDEEDELADQTVEAAAIVVPPSELESLAIPPLSKAEKEKLKKKAQKIRQRERERVEKRKFLGVDLESLVLLNPDHRYFITDRRFVEEKPDYTPPVFIVLSVRFANDQTHIFLLDSVVFVFEDALPPALIRAVFNQLKGLPVDRADLGEEIKGTSILGDRPSRPPAPESEYRYHIGWPLGEADFESVRDYIRVKPARKQLLTQYGGIMPSDQEWIHDTLQSQREQLVVIHFGALSLLTRDDLLSDRKNGSRWVFNMIQSINSSKSLTQSRLILVDTRVIDEAFCEPLKAEFEGATKQRRNKDYVRKYFAQKQRPPIFAALAQYANYLDHETAPTEPIILEIVRHFEKINAIQRPDRPDLKTIEFMLRPSSEMKQIETIFDIFTTDNDK